MTLGTKEKAFKKIRVTGMLSLMLITLIMNLTACGSSNAEDMPDTAAGETTVSISETYEEYMTLAADCYRQQDWGNALVFYQNAKKLDADREEVYRGMSDVYLQMDDVIQALAILDEGMEKCGESRNVDSLSQRKEYVLAGMVAVGRKIATNDYYDDGSIFLGSVSERDENGNEIKSVNYGAGGEISRSVECKYDGKGNQIEYEAFDYDADGNRSCSYHKKWIYDENGNQISSIGYDENGNIKSKTETEYDTYGNIVSSTEYDKEGRQKRKTKSVYDENGNEIKSEVYDKYGSGTKKIIRDYDENGNLTKYVRYDAGGNAVEKWEREYDKNGNETKYVYYDGALTIDGWNEREYDENGNEIRFVRYDSEGNISSMWEKEYDENGNETRYVSYDDEGNTSLWESEYDENGNVIKQIRTYDDEEDREVYESLYEYDTDGRMTRLEATGRNGSTGVIYYRHQWECSYDENGNRTEYTDMIYDGDGKSYGYRWEREYNENSNEIAFRFYDNSEKTASYQSETEYNENGLVIKYTGCDKNGNVLVRKETEYDASGKVIRENNYDTDGNLLRHYENEYDDFGSVTRQSMYEGGILKSEKQISYAYRYIGNIDAEAADYMDNDITPEEYNLKQREIFTRFLDGQEKVRYCSNTDRHRIEADSIEDGKIVEKTITDLIDFEYCRQHNESLKYTFLDMTGDGMEELIISCDEARLYVIQSDYGVLKVIQDAVLDSYSAYLVKYNGRTGICCDFNDGMVAITGEYYFFDGKGKERISLYDGERYDVIDTYSVRDSCSFDWRDITEGEYYDIIGGMVTNITVDWNQLEEPCYGND